MDTEQLKYFFSEVRYFTLFPKRYKTTKIAERKAREDYWRKVARDYGNFKKRVDCRDWHWYVVTYKDGRKELAYFKVWRIVNPHGGTLRRGFLFPRYWTTREYEHVSKIRLAF